MSRFDWRERVGKPAWLTVFPDGTEIPWKLLSIGDYIYYSHAISEGQIPSSILEDEIFKKCCLRPAFLYEINDELAGIVSEVVKHILEKSGPVSPEDFNERLDIGRKASELPLNLMISIIGQAFPSYRPEDIEALDINVFMLRLAQAETILLRNKILEKPISLSVGKPLVKRPPRLGNLKQEFEKKQPAGKPTPAIINMEEENASIMKTVGGNKWVQEERAKATKNMLNVARQIYGDPIPPEPAKPVPPVPQRRVRQRKG